MKLVPSLLAVVCVCIVLTDARITVRSRRQVEREDGGLPASEVVVIKDTVNPRLPGPLFLVPRLPGPGDAFDLDINEQDGTFTFGGMLPPHMHHFHSMQRQSFGDLFDAIQRRFDEMTRNMMSFNNFGPGFNPTTDIGSLPDDYNKTDSEIVELGGHRYVKKTTTLKKGGPGSSFFVRSTTFERVNDEENGADLPSAKPQEGAKEEEEDKKESKPEESAPEGSSTGAPPPAVALPSDPKEGPDKESESSPKDSSDGPDVRPSSESPTAAAGEAEEPAAAAGEREEEEETVASSSTEQP